MDVGSSLTLAILFVGVTDSDASRTLARFGCGISSRCATRFGAGSSVFLCDEIIDKADG